MRVPLRLLAFGAPPPFEGAKSWQTFPPSPPFKQHTGTHERRSTLPELTRPIVRQLMSECRPSSRSDGAHSESASGPPILRLMRNIEIDSLVRRCYELVDENRLEDLLSLFSEDTIYRRPGYEPLQGKGVLRHFYSVEREIYEGQHHIHQIMIDGRSVAVEGHFVGLLKSGIGVTVRFAEFFQLSQEKLIARHETYFYVPSI